MLDGRYGFEKIVYNLYCKKCDLNGVLVEYIDFTFYILIWYVCQYYIFVTMLVQKNSNNFLSVDHWYQEGVSANIHSSVFQHQLIQQVEQRSLKVYH